MVKIIFQDVDGPLVPQRMKHRTGGYTGFDDDPTRTIIRYDPVAVDMINCLCEKHDAKMVYNSAHGYNPALHFDAKKNGLFYLHEDYKTKFPHEIWERLDGVKDWLERHKDEGIERFVIIDDALIWPERQVHVDFDIGMTHNDFWKADALLK